MGEKASCGWKSLYRRRQAGRKNLLWVKKPAWEEAGREKEPPAGQKACIRGEKQEEEASCGVQNTYRRILPCKLNPIKWTQQKPIWDVFWKPVSYCGHSKN